LEDTNEGYFLTPSRFWSTKSSRCPVWSPYARETDKWLYFASEIGPGKVRYVHKNHLINFEVVEKMVTVSMRKTTAIAKGLIAASLV
jgi:hypothetical protein